MTAPTAAAWRPSVTGMTEPVDVVLPCLDEAAALPWVLARIPAGYRSLRDDHELGPHPASTRLMSAMVRRVPRTVPVTFDRPVRGA